MWYPAIFERLITHVVSWKAVYKLSDVNYPSFQDEYK